MIRGQGLGSMLDGEGAEYPNRDYYIKISRVWDKLNISKYGSFYHILRTEYKSTSEKSLSVLYRGLPLFVKFTLLLTIQTPKKYVK